MLWLEARAGYLFCMAPLGGAVFLKSPQKMEIHVIIFKLINLFFILYLNFGRFLSTKTSEI